MKRKIRRFLPIIIALWFLSFVISIKIGIILLLAGVLVSALILLFFLLNKRLKETNWWKNQYIGTTQFVTGVGYRQNIIRNYDIVNLGSNPARFAFFYEDVKGQSWATGSQGQDMDFEILKFYHSYLKEGGVVLIPIMPFTAISPYLKERNDYWGLSYYSKFAKILNREQIRLQPFGDKVYKYLQYPLFYNKKAIRYLLSDVSSDSRYHISEQPLMKMELEFDANNWINNWREEFHLKTLMDVKDVKWRKYYDAAVEINKNIVEFCLQRELRPVFVCVPMTKHLSSLFPQEFCDYMITDFIKKINVHNIPFLDYTKDARFIQDEYYMNSFFLNLKGRKLFTKQVVADLNSYLK